MVTVNVTVLTVVGLRVVLAGLAGIAMIAQVSLFLMGITLGSE